MDSNSYVICHTHKEAVGPMSLEEAKKLTKAHIDHTHEVVEGGVAEAWDKVIIGSEQLVTEHGYAIVKMFTGARI